MSKHEDRVSDDATKTDSADNALPLESAVSVDLFGDEKPGSDDQQAEQTSDADAERDPSDDVNHADAPFGYRADGTPRISNAGRKSNPGVVAERAKQRQRLKSVTPSKTKPTRPEQAPQVPALAIVNYQAMGEAVASMFFSVGVLALGPDWEPDRAEGEPQAVAGAFRDYFKATNMRDLPPGFALCFVLSVYTLKRASKPTIAGKLSLFGAWVKTRVPSFGRKRVYMSDTARA